MLKKIILGLVALPLLISAFAANADVYSFTKITSNNVEDLSGQLSVDVTDAGGGLVSFNFLNNVGIASSVTDIYFDNGSGTYISLLSLGTQTGVNFGLGATPSNLPGGNPVSFTSDFGADSNSPISPNGINSSTDSLQLLGTGTFSYIISGLSSGDFRIGLHVQSIGALGGSDSYVTTPSAVPVPTSAWLLVSGLAIFGVMRRRIHP